MNNHTRMYLRMIAQSFLHRISRVIIASLSIAVGAWTVPDQMSKELRSFGANLIVVPDGAQMLSDAQLKQADAEVGSSALSRAPHQYTNLLYNQQALSVMGTDLAGVEKVRPYWDVDGTMPTGPDQILVGANVADQYGFTKGKVVGLSEPTRKDGVAKQLTVTGVLRTGDAEDDLIVMSLDNLRQFTGGKSSYNLIEYSVNSDATTLAGLAKKVSGSVSGADGEVVRRTSQSEGGIAATLQSLIWIVSVLIFLLTLPSISATLNAVVSERSREIGLKKALGALPRDIVGEFIGESVLLGLIGGVVGLFAGVWIADWISMKAFTVNLDVNWWVVAPITLVVSVAVALAGSLLPARRISRIKPADVLGGE